MSTYWHPLLFFGDLNKIIQAITKWIDPARSREIKSEPDRALILSTQEILRRKRAHFWHIDLIFHEVIHFRKKGRSIQIRTSQLAIALVFLSLFTGP